MQSNQNQTGAGNESHELEQEELYRMVQDYNERYGYAEETIIVLGGKESKRLTNYRLAAPPDFDC